MHRIAIIEMLNAWAVPWAEFMARGLVDATALLAILALVWLPLKRQLSAQLSHGLFLLVLLKLTVPVPISVPRWLAECSPTRLASRYVAGSPEAVAPEPPATEAPAPPAASPAIAFPTASRDRSPDFARTVNSEANRNLAVPDPATPAAPPMAFSKDPSLETARAEPPPPPTSSMPAAEPPTPPALTIRARLMLGWAALTALLLARFVRSLARSRQLIRDACPLEEGDLAIDLEALQRSAGVRIPVRWASSPRLSSPAVGGLLRPTVVIPPDLAEGLTPNQLSWVLLHELAHVRRGDLWIVVFQRVIQSVYFFHPAVWAANWIIDQLREYACDDAALVAANVPRRDCGEGFLSVVRLSVAADAPLAPALGLFESRMFIRNRLVRILDRRRVVHRALSARSAAGLAALALVVLPYARARDDVPDPGPSPVQQPKSEPKSQFTPTRAAGEEATAPSDGPEPTHYKERAGFPKDEPTGVWSAAFSPDGKRLATAHEGGKNKASTVKVWDVAARKPVLVLVGPGTFRSVAYSPDGRLIAAGSFDNSTRIWDAATGKLLHTMIGTSGINTVAFSPDGKSLVTGSWDNVIRVYHVASGRESRTFKGNPGQPTTLVFSPDGKTLAESCLDKTAILWDFEAGTITRVLRGHTEHVESVAFSPDGKTIATGSWDKTIKLWDAETGAERATLEGHTEEVLNVRFAPDGKTLASSSGEFHKDYSPGPSEVKLWDLAKKAEIATLRGHKNRTFALAFHPDGKLLVTGSGDRSAKLWDTANGDEVATLGPTDEAPEAGAPVVAMACSPDGMLLATASEEKTIEIRDVTTGRSLATLDGHDDAIACLAFSPDGKTLASGSFDKTIKLWEPETGREKATLSGHTNWVFAVAFRPDGKSLASAGYDKTVRLWDLETSAQTAVMEGHKASVRAVAFRPDGKVLASGGGDRMIKLWDVATHAETAALKGHKGTVRALGFAPDGKTLASGAEDDAVKLWDVAKAAERATLSGHTDMVWTLAFSPAGTTLATAGLDATIRLWDPTTGTARAALPGHTDGISGLAFAPGGRLLISGSFDRSVKFWEPSVPVIEPAAGVESDAETWAVAYAPDGKTMVFAGKSPTLVIWDTATRKGRPAPGDHAATTVVAFSPDGDTFATGRWDGKVHLCDSGTGEIRGTLEGHTGPVRWLAFHPDGRTLATAGYDKTARLWDLRTKKVTLSLPAQPLPVNRIAFSPDGKTLATATGDWQAPIAGGEVRLWEAATAKPLATLRGHDQCIFGLAFSPDGKALATASLDKAKLWDLATSQAADLEKPHALALAFAPDGKTLAVGYAPGETVLWDRATHRQTALMKAHKDMVFAVAFRPDGRELATVSRDGSLKLFDLAPAPTVASSLRVMGTKTSISAAISTSASAKVDRTRALAVAARP